MSTRESHITARSVDATISLPTCARNEPSGPGNTSASPPILNRNARTAGFLAAAGVFTTRTWVNPVQVARTTRSTSGNTFGYVTESPDTVGAGNASGQDKATVPPPRVNVTIGASPPSENATSATDTAGRHNPSPPRTNRKSTSAHSPARRARCGTTDDENRNRPSGNAVTSENSVRDASTTTG
ncbi:hypothetical protein [Salinispora arenicola]|uniref:hypothetical protein n=1 Tax=Salinispora arenicola TaxID=168697 RepID=UPI001E39788F|nr:hypothetical protein [Salinispora arenicola]